MAARAWIMVAGAVLTGSSRASLQLLGMQEKPPDSGGFFNFPLCGEYPAGLLDIGGSLC